MRMNWYARLLAATAVTVAAPAGADSLLDGFRSPPPQSRPRLWWHWMNGNITEDGIAADLEWMKRIGIGGFQLFDANLATPKVVDTRLAYMDPSWQHAFALAIRKASASGLEAGIAASAGWSVTGGPWVTPDDGMKKLVWSETVVRGGRRLAVPLARPPVVTGPFQDVALPEGPADGARSRRAAAYRDIRVLAYPLPRPATLVPEVVQTSSKAALEVLPLVDGALDRAQPVSVGTAAAPGHVDILFSAPQTVRSLTLSIAGLSGIFTQGPVLPVLQWSVDGEVFKDIAPASLDQTEQATISFPAVTARWFRVVLRRKPGLMPRAWEQPLAGSVNPYGDAAGFPGPDGTLGLRELRLSSEARIDNAELKAAFGVPPEYFALPAPRDDASGILVGAVVDLSARMRPDGMLDWTPPPGDWRVLRLGWSLTGKENGPATPEATGLEVDKFDAAAVRRYLKKYLQTYRTVLGDGLIGKKGLGALVVDSIEAGPANWTPALIEAFKARRGYDPTPWLAALTGVLIGTRTQSDSFLYDYRRTLAELLADSHYGTISRVAHEHGLTVYGEALEQLRPSLGDDLTMRRFADVPMAALWVFPPGDQPYAPLRGDLKGAASVAHVYGQKLVAAESMTSAWAPWSYAPSDLRRVIDYEFASGINLPVIHGAVHQPRDDLQPGLTLAYFGQFFSRHESWAEQARPWIDYIARASFLLQQGRHAGDIAYFTGEEAPVTALEAGGRLDDTPRGFGFDLIGPDALLHQIEVQDGMLVTPHGARYRLLQLGAPSRMMTLPTLRRIADLVERGATVVGAAPVASPALADDPRAFRTLVGRMWSGGGETRIGKGRVVAASDAAAVLRSDGVVADFEIGDAVKGDMVRWLHRRLDDGDVYFVTNQGNSGGPVELRFGVTGQAPELWDAEHGTTRALSYRVEHGQTVVPLNLPAFESGFILFRGPAAAPASRIVTPAVRHELAALGDGWSLDFIKGPARPQPRTRVALGDWTQDADRELRYFSGTAAYWRSLDVPRRWLGAGRLLLDLGSVGDLADVRINGRSAGIAWKAPFEVDVTGLLRPGRNRIEIQIVNLWRNRLIGDVQPGATKAAYVTFDTYRPDAALRPSGLIGPVTLLRETAQ